MAKKRRMRKTGALNASEVVETQEEPPVTTQPQPSPVPAPDPKPATAPIKTLTSWIKGSSEEE